MVFLLLVFDEEWEEVRHRSGPNLAQSVVIETLVKADHPADMFLTDQIQSGAVIATGGEQGCGLVIEAIGIEILVEIGIIGRWRRRKEI